MSFLKLDSLVVKIRGPRDSTIDTVGSNSQRTPDPKRPHNALESVPTVLTNLNSNKFRQTRAYLLANLCMENPSSPQERI
jgi:hypothetical protein